MRPKLPQTVRQILKLKLQHRGLYHTNKSSILDGFLNKEILKPFLDSKENSGVSVLWLREHGITEE